MNTELLHLWGLNITPWKLIGYTGTLLFTLRWLVQAWASRQARRSVLPRSFWYMSILGSLLLLIYFIFGKNDSVGILANAFPFFMAFYNLIIEFKSPPHPPTAATMGEPGETAAEDTL